MPSVCKNCGSNDIDNDSTRGGAVCTGCGSVVEESAIVTEREFAENSAGGTGMIGQFVSEDERHGYTPGVKAYKRDCREAILQKGRNIINQIGSQLRLSQRSLDSAFMYYKLAVTRRFAIGRGTIPVIGACLYLVCRTEHTTHLLIDVCDAAQVDIFRLGRVFLQLTREFCIEVSTIDPSLYIHRFASKLRFGEKENEVAMTALRLLSRMKRDWMITGRRPSGLCGAALFVAGKLHGFNTTMKDIVRIVRLSTTTIAKRLTDFSRCPSSKLTIEEFKRVDLEEEMDPPCFIEGRQRTKQVQLFGDNGELVIHDVLNRVTFTKNQIELYLERRKEIKQQLQEKQQLVQETKRRREEGNQFLESKNALNTSELSNGEKNPKISKTEQQPRPEQCSTEEEKETNMKPATAQDPEELDFEDLDDDELDCYLLSGEEIELKTKVWMKENGEFMVELKAKEELKAQEEAEKKTKSKRQKRTKKEKQVADSADEAILNMLSEKKLSAKINYDVLKDLTDKPETAGTENTNSTEQQTPMEKRLFSTGASRPNLTRSTQYARKLQPKSIQGGRMPSFKKSKVLPKVHFGEPSSTSKESFISPKTLSETRPGNLSSNSNTKSAPDNLNPSKETLEAEDHHQVEDHHEDDYFNDDENELEAEHEAELSASQLFSKDIGHEEYGGYEFGGYGEEESFY